MVQANRQAGASWEADHSMDVHTTISYEASDYETALSRAQLDVVRTGAGYGPNSLVNLSLDGVEFFSGHLQFPVIGRTTLSDEVIAVILIVEAPPGTRWCELDVAPGDVLLYGPGTEHTGLSPEGVEYRFALVDVSLLDDTAEELRAPILHPARGSVTRFDPAQAVRALGSELHSFASPLGPPDELPPTSARLARATTRVLTDPSSSLRERQARRIQNRTILTQCIAYSDVIERRPSIGELCIAAHVSERRLRTAFYDVFDMPPHQYMRMRSLNQARERLISGERSVTQVALDLGFQHLGRFAGQYAALYGEHPRDTLGAARSRASLGVHRPIAGPAPHSLTLA